MPKHLTPSLQEHGSGIWPIAFEKLPIFNVELNKRSAKIIVGTTSYCPRGYQGKGKGKGKENLCEERIGRKSRVHSVLNILSEYGIKTTKHSFILKGCKGNRIFRKEGLCLCWAESWKERFVRKSNFSQELSFFGPRQKYIYKN